MAMRNSKIGATGLRPPWNEEVGDEDLHGFAALVQRGRSNFGQAAIGMRHRGTDLQHLAFEVKCVARPHRLWPAEFVHSGSHNAADNRQALEQEAAS